MIKEILLLTKEELEELLVLNINFPMQGDNELTYRLFSIQTLLEKPLVTIVQILDIFGEGKRRSNCNLMMILPFCDYRGTYNMFLNRQMCELKK